MPQHYMSYSAKEYMKVLKVSRILRIEVVGNKRRYKCELLFPFRHLLRHANVALAPSPMETDMTNGDSSSPVLTWGNTRVPFHSRWGVEQQFYSFFSTLNEPSYLAPNSLINIRPTCEMRFPL